MKSILVTGAKGQLGNSILELSKLQEGTKFLFTDQDELDITKGDEVKSFFALHKPDYCINCAAYTAVDKAELESALAFKINSEGVKNLVEACMEQGTVFIQISTDFIFDGKKSVPYLETDTPNPISIYGKSKYDAERIVEELMEKYFIIRTSWVYSEYGQNFVKTMIRLAKERDSLSIIDDQVGTPTYATDLAAVILQIINEGHKEYGIYNYSGEGIASWYDFAIAIFEEKHMDIEVIPIPSEAYPTDAKRPSFSVLNKKKIRTNLGISIPHWRKSLRSCLAKFD